MTRGHGPGRSAARRGSAAHRGQTRLRADPATGRPGSGAPVRSRTETAANAGLPPDGSSGTWLAVAAAVGLGGAAVGLGRGWLRVDAPDVQGQLLVADR